MSDTTVTTYAEFVAALTNSAYNKIIIANDITVGSAGLLVLRSHVEIDMRSGAVLYSPVSSQPRILLSIGNASFPVTDIRLRQPSFDGLSHSAGIWALYCTRLTIENPSFTGCQGGDANDTALLMEDSSHVRVVGPTITDSNAPSSGSIAGYRVQNLTITDANIDGGTSPIASCDSIYLNYCDNFNLQRNYSRRSSRLGIETQFCNGGTLFQNLVEDSASTGISVGDPCANIRVLFNTTRRTKYYGIEIVSSNFLSRGNVVDGVEMPTGSEATWYNATGIQINGIVTAGWGTCYGTIERSPQISGVATGIMVYAQPGQPMGAVTVKNCAIRTGNEAGQHFAGIYWQGNSTTIPNGVVEDCDITGDFNVTDGPGALFLENATRIVATRVNHHGIGPSLFLLFSDSAVATALKRYAGGIHPNGGYAFVNDGAIGAVIASSEDRGARSDLATVKNYNSGTTATTVGGSYLSDSEPDIGSNLRIVSLV